MRTELNRAGRHRLGMPGGVHCVRYPAVAAAIAEYRRPWLTALLSPSRHSFVSSRRRPLFAVARWIPATAN
ncbi:hypothetical protein LTT61_27350 [Nocardia asteroides]|nr:hypothetical protein [Nocardia asteroides]UGT60827.1 hypothetical protein LTT61_27350 [Nocardia asteroides]